MADDIRVFRPSWSAIFAGTFVFLAIEATFGVLGTAIFATAMNPRAAHPVTGMSVGIGIWLVVLTIISLYCAGRAASHLSGVQNRLDGMYHGLVTFGLSIFASVLTAAIIIGSSPSMAPNVNVVSVATLGDIITTAGYWLFVALLLGGIAAAWGGSAGLRKEPVAVAPERVRSIA
jgi:hypothetical protein